MTVHTGVNLRGNVYVVNQQRSVVQHLYNAFIRASISGAKLRKQLVLNLAVCYIIITDSH